MSWINPEWKKKRALGAVTDTVQPVVRKCIRSVSLDPKSEYSPSRCTHGFVEVIQLREGEKLSERMALAFFNLKCDLEDWTRYHHPGATMQINPPEVFPVDKNQCLVLVTGWLPEKIILRS
jgi:hypothetical protein